MAAGDYLKMAAAQLQRAAKALQIESSKMLSEQTRLSTQKNFEISKHEIDLKADQVALSHQKSSNGSNPAYERQLQNEARALEQRISMKKNELRRINEQLTNVARAKQQAAQSLTNRARDLQMQASSPLFSS